jgi:hypothetical protein
MGSMDKFFVERKVTFEVAYSYDDFVTDDDGQIVACGIKAYGYSVIENSFDGISVEGTNITMGDRDIVIEVKSCVNNYRNCDMNGKLPALYCVRQHDGSYARFVCGMDLCRNGMIWLGLEGNGIFFSNINNALSYLKDRLGEFEIHTEEPMMSNF